MRTLLSVSIAACLVLSASAQTEVRTSSFTFSSGVCPTFSVVFAKADADVVEKWFKDQLKPISADVSSKKEIMSIGTRLPEVSSDTMRVFVKAEQLKRNPDVTLHVAFRVNGSFVGPDNDARQVEGCRNWLYQHAVMLKKELTQKELEAANKDLARLQDQLASLVKEKDRAQNSIEKTTQNITEDEQAKAAAEGESTNMVTRVDAKRQDVSNAPTETNTKELQGLLKDQEKLNHKVEKLTNNIASGKKKIEDLQYAIKKNLDDQDGKAREIDVQKKVVEDVRQRLANIN